VAGWWPAARTAAPAGLGNGVAWVATKISLLPELRTGATGKELKIAQPFMAGAIVHQIK